jgi:site-specific recombinase XerD
VAAYLTRFKGSSREHTQSDLRSYLTRCAERGLDPLAARRPHLELYIRWMQEIRRFKPSTVSRRFSVAAGFYRTCAERCLVSARTPWSRLPRLLGLRSTQL